MELVQSEVAGGFAGEPGWPAEQRSPDWDEPASRGGRTTMTPCRAEQARASARKRQRIHEGMAWGAAGTQKNDCDRTRINHHDGRITNEQAKTLVNEKQNEASASPRKVREKYLGKPLDNQ